MLKDFQIKGMFESIAFSYDFQNSFLSLGRDKYWRRVLAESVRLHGGRIVLDMATGTGEVAIEIYKRIPEVRVIALDFSPSMLAIAQKKVRSRGLGDRIRLSLGDARCLPLKNSSFDLLTIAFGIRNIEQCALALAEFRRVLKPGGKLLIMEFDYPENPVLKKLYRLYFDWVLPPVGNWLSRTDYAYSHLVESVRRFPRQEKFLADMAAAGFSDLGVKRLTYGIARIYKGVNAAFRRHSSLR